MNRNLSLYKPTKERSKISLFREILNKVYILLSFVELFNAVEIQTVQECKQTQSRAGLLGFAVFS